MNVFITRTPYHVLLAHAVCRAERKDSEGVAAEPGTHRATLIYTGASLDAIDPIVDESYWSQTLHFLRYF